MDSALGQSFTTRPNLRRVVPECVGCCVPCMLSGGARSSESERRSTEQWSEAGRARTLDGGPRDPISSAGSIWCDGDSGGRNLIRAGSVRCCPPAVSNSECRTGLPYLATTSEARRHARCAAAPRSEFRACERDPPPSPSHLQCLLAYTWGTPSLRCGASCTFILSLQRHGRNI